MTVTSTPPSSTRAPGVGPGVIQCAGLASVIVLGPLSVAVLRALLPYNTTDKAATITAKVAAHQVAQSGTLWLTLIVPLSAAWSGARAARLVAARHNWSLDAKIAQIRLNMAAS
jgi:hypothetical protein